MTWPLMERPALGPDATTNLAPCSVPGTGAGRTGFDRDAVFNSASTLAAFRYAALSRAWSPPVVA